MTMIGTNHDDEMSREDSRCGCDDGHDEAVKEAKKITWDFHLHFIFVDFKFVLRVEDVAGTVTRIRKMKICGTHYKSG